MKTIYLHNLQNLAGGTLKRRFLFMPVSGHNSGKVQGLPFIRRTRTRSAFVASILMLLVVQLFVVVQVPAQEKTSDAEKIERLERLIKAQQQQLESLQQQLNELKQTATDAQTQAKEGKSVAEDSKFSLTLVQRQPLQATVDKLVTSGGGERVKLAISGQVNRAVNIVDDGKTPRPTSSTMTPAESRVRFVGTARATDDLTLGGPIELTIAPNNSGNVSQR